MNQIGFSKRPGSVITAYLNGDPTTAFTLSGVVVPRKQVDCDAGVNVFFEDEGFMFIGDQGTYRGSMSAHGTNAAFHLEF